MWSRRRLLAPVLVIAAGLAVALAGCDDIQHPFQPESKPLPAVLRLPWTAPTAVTVAPVRGVPAAFGRALAEAMVTALRKKDVPATADDPAGDEALYSITGMLVPQDAGAGGGQAIRWEVRDEQGELAGRYFQPIPPGGDPLAPATRDRLLAGLGDEPAEAMIKGIEGDASIPSEKPASAQAAAGRSLVVTRIEGAPVKDGDIILRQAIEYALKVSHVRVTTERTPGSLTLAATIQQSQLEGGLQRVTVTWSLLRPDGKEVGQVSQENNVPTEVLKTAWGEIANAVARNAADGIAALVERADAKAVN